MILNADGKKVGCLKMQLIDRGQTFDNGFDKVLEELYDVRLVAFPPPKMTSESRLTPRN